MEHKNIILKRTDKKPILWDAFYKATDTQKPLVIFCHGYKGFKDWGAWDLVAKSFADAGLFFVKFNFSHNGGTMEQPIDFPDLEAFAENNYSRELEDLDDLITFLHSASNPFQEEIDPNQLIVIGHSRGGGIVTIKASEDQRITKVITWASVSDFGRRTATSGELEEWRKNGVKYVFNGRTKQNMPHNFQFYEDFKAHEARLNIEQAVKRLNIPHLIIHSKEDPSVFYTEAEEIHSWNPESILHPIAHSDHVFSASHPWTQADLPQALKTVVQESMAFIGK